MTQLSPTNISTEQIAAKIRSLRSAYEAGVIRTPHELMVQFESALSDYISKLGMPTVDWEPIVKGEPPSSEKMNRFWDSIIVDMTTAQHEVDLLRSSAVLTHNLIKTELLKARSQNGQLNNKLKTLQLYSTAQDEDVVVFGDYFMGTDFTDTTLTNTVDNAGIGKITLSKLQDKNIISKAKITILDTSNGFAGNNQEILDPESAEVDPVTKEKRYVFYGESGNRGDLRFMSDSNPVSWFEYENNLVFPGDRAAAKNFNFTYANDQDLPGGAHLDWAEGPSEGVLRLNLMIDLQSINKINNISYSPFGLTDNKNHPVKIKSVSISENATEWQTVGQENIWVGTNTSLQTLRVANNIALGDVEWSFSPANVRYIRFEIEQPNSIDSNIGHLYYQQKEKVETREIQIPDPENPAALTTYKEIVTTEGERVEGPKPRVSRPWEHYSSSRTDFGSYIQKREFFKGKRWAIGIRDIFIGESVYAQTGSYVSKPFKINGIVDRVAIEADYSIPANFDPKTSWVEFYISPNDGLNWFRISPIENNYEGHPEIVVFNDPLPIQFAEENASYQKVSNTVDSIRVKIVLKRSNSETSATPVVNNYRLKIRRR